MEIFFPAFPKLRFIVLTVKTQNSCYNVMRRDPGELCLEISQAPDAWLGFLLPAVPYPLLSLTFCVNAFWSVI